MQVKTSKTVNQSFLGLKLFLKLFFLGLKLTFVTGLFFSFPSAIVIRFSAQGVFCFFVLFFLRALLISTHLGAWPRFYDSASLVSCGFFSK